MVRTIIRYLRDAKSAQIKEKALFSAQKARKQGKKPKKRPKSGKKTRPFF